MYYCCRYPDRAGQWMFCLLERSLDQRHLGAQLYLTYWCQTVQRMLRRQPLKLLHPDADQGRLEQVDARLAVPGPGASVHLLPPGHLGRGQAETVWWPGGWRTQDERLVVRPRPRLITHIFIFWFEGVKKQQSFESYLDSEGNKKAGHGITNSYQGRTKEVTALSLYINNLCKSNIFSFPPPWPSSMFCTLSAPLSLRNLKTNL